MKLYFVILALGLMVSCASPQFLIKKADCVDHDELNLKCPKSAILELK